MNYPSPESLKYFGKKFIQIIRYLSLVTLGDNMSSIDELVSANVFAKHLQSVYITCNHIPQYYIRESRKTLTPKIKNNDVFFTSAQ